MVFKLRKYLYIHIANYKVTQGVEMQERRRKKKTAGLRRTAATGEVWAVAGGLID